MATPLLNLDLPTVSVTLGPTWASEVNAAFEVIDSHDHSSGKGARIPTAGLNINANLDFNSFAALNLQIANLQNRTTSPSGSSFSSSISVFNNDLYFTNASGVAIQLTSGGSIITAPGAIQAYDLQTVSSDIVIAPSDTFVFLEVDTTAARNITLPLAASVSSGRIYIIKDASGQANTNNITLAASGSDTIDGASSQTFNSNYGSYQVVTNGTDSWYVA